MFIACFKLIIERREVVSVDSFISGNYDVVATDQQGNNSVFQMFSAIPSSLLLKSLMIIYFPSFWCVF